MGEWQIRLLRWSEKPKEWVRLPPPPRGENLNLLGSARGAMASAIDF